jgi:hypothetical protein
MQTIEISGRPTVVVNGSEDEVQALLEDEEFYEDLLIFETEGEPLWSGIGKTCLSGAHLRTKLRSGKRHLLRLD